MRAQMDLLENNAMEKVGEYLEAGEPQTLLQYATTMKMRPLGAGRVAPKKDSGGAGGGYCCSDCECTLNSSSYNSGRRGRNNKEGPTRRAYA